MDLSLGVLVLVIIGGWVILKAFKGRSSGGYVNYDDRPNTNEMRNQDDDSSDDGGDDGD